MHISNIYNFFRQIILIPGGRQLLTVAVPALLILFSGSAFAEGRTYTARELWQHFEDDAAAAESSFLGQRLDVTGIVTGTAMSIYVTPYVSLSDSSEGHVYADCVFPRSEIGTMSQFQKGDQVTVNCRVVYRKDTDGDSIVIKDCRRVR